MTEMTMPDVPESRKRNKWKVPLAVVIIAVLFCLCLSITIVLAIWGTKGDGPLKFLKDILPPTGRSLTGDWTLYYDWDCTGEYAGPIILSFNSDQTFSVTESGYTSYGTWSITSTRVDFAFDEYPNTRYIGSVDSASTSMEGTMSNLDGGSGCWYGGR
jgi:hypothetical protein